MVGFCHVRNLQESYDDNDDEAFRQIPHMTKSHHGGNMSLIGEVGFCHRHIPTIDNYDDEVGLGVFVDLWNKFNSSQTKV